MYSLKHKMSWGLLITSLSSLVWQFKAAASLLRMSSSFPYGRFLPSEEVTTTRPYCAGLAHSTAILALVPIQ